MGVVLFISYCCAINYSFFVVNYTQQQLFRVFDCLVTVPEELHASTEDNARSSVQVTKISIGFPDNEEVNFVE